MLDDPGEWQLFSRPKAASQADGEWISYIAIEGMWCPACSLAVEEALTSCGGVGGVQVNGATATARIDWNPAEGRPSQWWQALARAGYGASPAGDMISSEPRRREKRMLLWRWLVAGFCMMQVMMYAVPAYIAKPGEITPDAEMLLHWASWLLTLPVLLFSCFPFFRSALRDLRHGRIGMDVPVALGIFVAFAASTAATFDPSSAFAHETWFDSITMFVFFLLSGRMIEQRLRDRTAGALEALARRLPETVLRDSAQGRFERVSVRKLAAGNRIRVLAGEVMPADGEVTLGEGLLAEALLTGESKPVARRVGDRVVAGSHNVGGAIDVRVTCVGADTRFAQIVQLMEQAGTDKPRAAQLADRFASPFLAAVLVASALAAVWWWPTGPAHAIGIAIAVLIVTCPCALSLATPAAALAAAGALARRGIVVRRLAALEAAAKIDTIVFDKTGTLTDPVLALTSVHTRVGTDRAEALSLAALIASHSLHPVSRALANAAPPVAWHVCAVTELPGNGLIADLLDTTREGLPTRRFRLGSAAFCGAPARDASSGRVHLSEGDSWIASFALDEVARADAREAVSALRNAGFDIQLLSGDSRPSVDRIARMAGIESAQGVALPEDKLAYVKQLQAAGRRIVMVGDGINDGPVLARADVSIAMDGGAPLAQLHSDFIVSGGKLGAVPLILQQARRTQRIVRENLAWAAAYNFTCVPLALAGWMPPWLAGLGMAASSLIVVLNSARLASFAKESG